MTVVSMSKREFNRLDVLLRVQSGRLRIADACELIGVRRRQVLETAPPRTHAWIMAQSNFGWVVPSSSLPDFLNTLVTIGIRGFNPIEKVLDRHNLDAWDLGVLGRLVEPRLSLATKLCRLRNCRCRRVAQSAAAGLGQITTRDVR
jgi:hypothetical protein